MFKSLSSAVTVWISSFLRDRVQRTMVDGNLSRPIKTNTGTPQGSVLSPLLFSIYTDRITSELSNVTIIKYADDTCIIGCISNQQDLDSYFNEIDRISKQCSDYDLLLNASKTQEILFSTQRTKPHTPPIVLNGESITMRKGCGPDSISPRLLKTAAHTLAEPVHTLFNNSISQGIFPHQWKLSNIKPIPKIKTACAVKDFRPIALTSVLSKCLERLQVKHYLPLVTDPHQFAYRPGRSTDDALLLTLDLISEHLDCNSKNSFKEHVLALTDV